MSEQILKALMHLFAIVADVDDVDNRSRRVVAVFLKQLLNQQMVEEYLHIYDEYMEQVHKISKKKEGRKKRTALNSVKVLKICTQINSELEQSQKVIVLVRLLEYINSDKGMTDQALEFVTTVAETFNISDEEFNDCINFITKSAENMPDSEDFLSISNEKEIGKQNQKHIYSEGIDGTAVVLNINSVGMFVLRYFSASELLLNGQVMTIEMAYILTPGSSMRSSRVNPIYYSDIMSRFLADESKAKIIFNVDHIMYHFRGGKVGLQPLTFSEQSGNMIGIMGGSGAGKSTLLNVLNGINAPTQGSVSINGIDIHKESNEIEGVIGYVSQDDLLIEELTVYQNLFYNAKLCFGNKSEEEIAEMVNEILRDLGLFETRNLKVGSPLDKKISGGQRKRLNIGLELIREPSVMFVDEPTSGLSSRDSENIMDLLKELALKGKLIFVVIHQPSSDIFKMFDRLLILDVGGYPIYFGNPVDAVIYFKRAINHVKAEESECLTCGNVNPEQIFNIIESKVLDEYGNITDNRKIMPKEWNERYKEILEHEEISAESSEIPESTFKIPGLLKQFGIFITRDVMSKLTNRQYLLINLLEAPALAFILSYFIKFYNLDVSNEYGYVFFENENIVAYLFMAVVVALFIGLTVSAEEIIRDQKIRKRESFLNLSNGSYLASKILIMFILSAIQSFTFILVGNLVLGIKGMWFSYWMILFSTACFANILGLNISASFNSAVTIYILIPILIIPQLLFSGVIVKFEKLNPIITSQEHVPFIGDIMTSRWAFEALSVTQFKANAYRKQFYPYEKQRSVADFRKVHWIPRLSAKADEIINAIKAKEKDARSAEKIANALKLIKHELSIEDKLQLNKRYVQMHKAYRLKPYVPFTAIEQATPETVNPQLLNEFKAFLDQHKRFYMKMYNSAQDRQDQLIRELQKDSVSKAAFNKLRRECDNENLSDLLTNKTELKKIIEIDDHLIQHSDPVFKDPLDIRAHFYAPRKLLFGTYIDTFWFNSGVIWLMSLVLIITLYFDAFRKLLEIGGR